MNSNNNINTNNYSSILWGEVTSTSKIIKEDEEEWRRKLEADKQPFGVKIWTTIRQKEGELGKLLTEIEAREVIGDLVEEDIHQRVRILRDASKIIEVEEEWRRKLRTDNGHFAARIWMAIRQKEGKLGKLLTEKEAREVVNDLLEEDIHLHVRVLRDITNIKNKI